MRLCEKRVPPHVKENVHTIIVHSSYAVRDGDAAND